MTTSLDQPLTARERCDYEKLTETVCANIAAVFQVGAALKVINDGRQYREEFPGVTFEEYAKRKWGLARSTASQYIEAAKVVEHVRNCGPTKTEPENESQARPLTRLDDPQEQAEAWERAVGELTRVISGR